MKAEPSFKYTHNTRKESELRNSDEGSKRRGRGGGGGGGGVVGLEIQTKKKKKKENLQI